MKKHLLITTILLLLPLVANAQTPDDPTDNRISTVTAYVGSVFDNFTSSEQRVYLNTNLAQVSGSTDERFLAGFNADVRVVGKKGDARQLWFFVETLHGVRSADVDCSGAADTRPAVCSGADTDPTKLGKQSSYILKNASSFEALAGFRMELWKPQPDLTIYLKGQLGMMGVAKHPGDAVDNHFAGVGLGATTGPLSGSYFDVGWGRTDLYANKRLDRWKFDGYVQFRVMKQADWFKPFVQVTADNDVGGGADSVQVYMGVNFDIGGLWR
jgi:hypothetical protein